MSFSREINRLERGKEIRNATRTCGDGVSVGCERTVFNCCSVEIPTVTFVCEKIGKIGVCTCEDFRSINTSTAVGGVSVCTKIFHNDQSKTDVHRRTKRT